MNRFQDIRSRFGKKPAAPESPLAGDQMFGAAPIDEGFQYNPIRQEILEPRLAELGFTLPADPNDPGFDDLVERVRQVDQGLAIDLVGMREPINTYHDNKIMQEARAKSDRSNMVREFIDDKLYIYNDRGERVLNKKIMVGLGIVALAALFPLANIKIKPSDSASASVGTTTQNADGSSTTNFEDGTVLNRLADGTEITRKPNGEVSTKTADGVTTTSYADGRKVVTQVDGSTIETLPDGSTTRRDANGQVIENTPPTTAALTSPLSTTTIKPGPQDTAATGPVNPITGLPEGGGTTVSSPDPSTANLDPITGMPLTDTSTPSSTSASALSPSTSGPAVTSTGYSDFGATGQGSATPDYADPYGTDTYSTTGGGTLGAASGDALTTPPAATQTPVAVTPVAVTPMAVTPAQPTPITAAGAPAPQQAVTVQPPVTTPAPATARTTVMRVNAASTGGQTGQQSSGQSGSQGQAASSNTDQGASVIYRKPTSPGTTVMRASSVTTNGAGTGGTNSGANGSSTFVYRRTSVSTAGTQDGTNGPATVASGAARTTSSAQRTAAQSSAPQNTGPVTAQGNETGPTSELFAQIFGSSGAAPTQTQPVNAALPASAAATMPSPYRLGQRFSAVLNTGVFVAQSSPSGLPVYAMSADGTMWRGWPTLDATKRVMITFDRAVLKDGQEVAVQAAGYNLDGTPGVKARYYDIAPTLANDIIRSGISGVNDFVQGKLNATRTTTNSNGSTVVEKQAPSIYESIGGATARVFTLPAAQNTFVTVAEIPVNTQIAIVYGPTTSDMSR